MEEGFPGDPRGTSRRVDSRHPGGRQGPGWGGGVVSGSSGLRVAGFCPHLGGGVLRLYIGPPEGGWGRSSVGVTTEKVRRPLGLTVPDRFPSLGRKNGRSQQPRLEVVPKHRVPNNTSL